MQPFGLRWRSSRIVAMVVLLIVALALRSFRALQEPVVNPDTIRFIDQAERLPVHPLEALRQEVYHPLHSIAGLAVHRVIARAFSSDRAAWLAAMQIVGILCGSIVALQIVWLARWLGAPFWAALGAGFVWTVGRRTSAFGADGLSDMLFLMLFMAAMLVGLRALRGMGRPGMGSGGAAGRWLMQFAVAGFLAGLSYLARPEGFGAPIILGVTVVLLALPRPRRLMVRAVRRRYKVMPRYVAPAGRAVAALLCLAVGAALPSVPYMLAIGRFTAKVREAGAATSGGAVALAGIAAAGAPLFQHTGRLVRELWETFGFAPWLVLLLALPLRPRWWGRPRLRLPVVVWGGLWIMLMYWLMERKSYLDGRHTLALIVLLHGLLALAFATWASAVRCQVIRLRREAAAGWQRWGGWPAVAGGTACFLAALPGMIRLGTPPLNDQYYIAQAAAWIRQNVRPGVTICDDELRIGYYSGHPYALWEGLAADPHLYELAEARQAGAPGGAPHAIVAGEIYRPGNGEDPLKQLGPYVEIARFHSAAAVHGDVLVLYARPEDHVLKEEPATTEAGDAAMRRGEAGRGAVSRPVTEPGGAAGSR